LKQVLLIDDNALQLSVREAVLRGAGFQVSVATTGESALAMLRVLRHNIGIVVTDHIMPGCDGPELVRRVRAMDPGLPIVVLSGLAEANAQYDGLNVVFRCKPFPPPELIELVRTTLGQPEQDRGAA